MKLYASLIHELFAKNCNRIKLGLDSVRQLDAELGFPSKAFQSIHIAGTNGKGSVTTKIAHILDRSALRAKKKIAHYTSPHISSFRERIQVQNQWIPVQDVERLLPVVLQASQKCGGSHTFFEITTALAFLYFADQNVDIAVLETGLGGRLDATNIIQPILSVITSIDWDHMDYLGNTLEKIAYEKSGIIKPQIPLVLGPKAASFEIFYQEAQKNNSPVYIAPRARSHFEEENQAIARCAIHILRSQINFPILAEDEEIGILSLPPCRFEMIHSPKTIILDVAHNPDGLKALFSRAKKLNLSFEVLFGLSANKQIEKCLEEIMQNAFYCYVTQAPVERAAKAHTIEAQFRQMNYSHFERHDDPKLALQSALRSLQPLIITGSFFIMAPIREALGFHDQIDPHMNF